MTPVRRAPKLGRSNVEVDQSGKIERTQEDTVLAFANGHKYAIRIPGVVKRRALHFLRDRRRPVDSKKAIYNRMFAAALFLLLKDHLDRLEYIIVDVEYWGGEADILRILLPMIWRLDPYYSSTRISFRQIGKGSPAHDRAWAVHAGMERADRVITDEDFMAVLLL